MIPCVFKQYVLVITLLIYIFILLDLFSIFKFSQIIYAEDITVTHAGYVLNFIFEDLILGLPNVLVFPEVKLTVSFLEVLLAIHVEIHLVLKHDVDFLLEFRDACEIILDLGVLSPFFHCRQLLLLEDQITCVLGD